MADGMLVFDLAPQVLPVEIGGKRYTLKEATGDVACQYQNAITNGVTLGPQGKPERMGNIADVGPFLVHLCLYDEADKRVPIEVVRSWPSRVVDALEASVKKISELDKDAQGGKVGNVSAPMQAGSA